MYSVHSFGIRSLVVVGSGSSDVTGSASVVVVGAGVEVVENQSPQIGAVPWHFGFSGSYVSPFAISSFTLYNYAKSKCKSLSKERKCLKNDLMEKSTGKIYPKKRIWLSFLYVWINVSSFEVISLQRPSKHAS